MTTGKLFAFSAMVTACATCAVLLQADLPGAGERAVAPSGAVALIGDCRLAGAIAEKDGRYFAEFEVDNPGKDASEVDFHYAVMHTPAMSPMSRMAPIPRPVANGHCTISVKAAGKATERVELSSPWIRGRRSDIPATAVAGQDDLRALTPEHWSLLISRTESPKAVGWGGVPPAVGSTTSRLDKGTMVLAASVETSQGARGAKAALKPVAQ